MATANAHIATERLGLFEQALLASGWATKVIDGETCWLAPEHLRGFAALDYGKGHLHLWDAMNLQVRADFATVSVLAA